ncbi:MAG: Gfo/Idh/MocA family protein [Sphingomonas sp.]
MASNINVAVVGLGKMGISHLAIARETPGLNVSAVCDNSSLLGGMVEKYTGIPSFSDYQAMLAQPGLDAVIIATPTRFHVTMVRQALEKGLHVFCEKPLTLTASDSAELARLAERTGRVGQVGYHNRFLGTFSRAKQIIDDGLIGRVRHVHAEAYGPVVLKPASKTWRSAAEEGGGCLYDYAAHPINLMNWYLGRPIACAGGQMTQQWSREVDDAVYAALVFPDGASAQVSVNWADETARKMTTRVSVWGDNGKLVVERQELQVFLGARATPTAEYAAGWTVQYITELTPHPAFYLRGEEYSAQLEGFVAAIRAPGMPYINDFASAATTDFTLQMIRDAANQPCLPYQEEATTAPARTAAPKRRKLALFGRLAHQG